MTLVTRAIPALYGGVSQQPDTQRSPIQLAEAINSWSTIVDGIGKRPPTESIMRLSATQYEDAYLHIINRDSVERYTVIVTDGDLKVYSLDGDEKTVAFPYGKAYLTTEAGKTAKQAFRCVTVADFTFVLNTDIAPIFDATDADRSASPVDYQSLMRSPTVGEGETWQYPPNPAIGPFMGKKQTFQDLPNTAAEGQIYQIVANADSGFQGYYVQRLGGTWSEVTRPGATNAIDPKSMPWALVRLGDGTFRFAPFSWAPRRVGDEVSNPGPSFLNRKITDIFFADNRLGFTADENTTLSRAGDFGNFFRMSAIDLYDDDTVDVATTETKVTKLQYAVPMNGGLMLFSDQVQFRLDKGDFMTPTSCSLAVTTQYPLAMLARPAPLGSDVYFASEEGGWVRLFEYFVRDDGDSLDAADVTSHVPRYIPKGIREIATSAEHDCVFLLTSGAKNCVYHYKFYWSGENEKAQSAWGHWEFPVGTSVVAAECIGQYLYLVVVRSSGTWLERVDLSGTAVAPGMTHQVYLDRRYEVDPYYDTPTGYTIFTLPYAVPPAERSTYRIVRGAGNGANTGAMIDPAQFVWLSDTSVKVAGNVCPANCFVGHQYTMRFRFSRWFMRDGQNNPDLSGRLQIRTVTLYYTRAGYFATEVAPYGGTPDIEEVAPAMLSQFTGKTTGNTLLGAPAFDDGSYSFQVYGNSEDSVISITNDSHLGAWFTSAEVEFFWQKRARFA